MTACACSLLVAQINTASLVLQQTSSLVGKTEDKEVTEMRIPLPEEYSMADAWCVVPGGPGQAADRHKDRIQPDTIRTQLQGKHNGLHNA